MADAMRCDVAVVGAGVLGCFAARNLARWGADIVVLEAAPDVCTGISKANSAIVYAGYDMHPGTLKARLTVHANMTFSQLADDLGIRYKQCGGIMAAFGSRGRESLERKLDHGRRNGLDNLRLVEGAEARAIEPALSSEVACALWCPSVGTVMPWDMAFAAADTARANGVRFAFNARVADIVPDGGGYRITLADGREVSCRGIVNCAGMGADAVHELVCAPAVRIRATKGAYLVLDEVESAKFSHVVFHERETREKGLTAVPCIGGHALVGVTETPDASRLDTDVSAGDIAWLRDVCSLVLPDIDASRTLSSFAAIRPNPYAVELRADGAVVEVVEGERRRSIRDFCVVRDAAHPAFVSLIGVKTPGLTCAEELGLYVASIVAGVLGLAPRPDFAGHRDPQPRFADALEAGRVQLLADRAADDAAWGNLVCRCERVTEAEIVRAVYDGAVSVDGVKRRCGAGMGRCQGASCQAKVAAIIARELGCAVEDVCKELPGSALVMPRR